MVGQEKKNELVRKESLEANEREKRLYFSILRSMSRQNVKGIAS